MLKRASMPIPTIRTDNSHDSHDSGSSNSKSSSHRRSSEGSHPVQQLQMPKANTLLSPVHVRESSMERTGKPPLSPSLQRINMALGTCYLLIKLVHRFMQ